jgi:site-specific DNA recombinase
VTRQQREDIQRVVKRAVIYCRVSTDEQVNNTSLETQEAECRAYAASFGLEVVAVIFESFTGTLLWERKELEKVRKMYRSGMVDIVIVYTYDRLSRDHIHFAILGEEMQRLGIQLLCAKEQLDNSLTGQFACLSMAFLPEFEYKNIIERTLTGRRNTITQKKKIIPTWKPRYGYRYDNPERNKKTCFVVNEEETRAVQYIYDQYDAGVSISDIVRALIRLGVKPPYKSWTRTAVLRILRYRPYTGKGLAFTEHKHNARYPIEPVELPEGLVPQIIADDLWERVQARLEIDQKEAFKNNDHPEEFLLRAGFVFCGICGRRMRCNRRVRGREKQWVSLRYMCTTHSDLNSTEATCPGLSVNAHKLDAIAWGYVNELTNETELLMEAIHAAMESNSQDSDMAAISNTIATWEARRDQYVEDLRNPSLRGRARDIILQELSQTEEMIEQLHLERRKVSTIGIDRAQMNRQYEILLKWLQRVRQEGRQEECEELTYNLKRDFLQFLGLEVYIYKTDKRYQDMQYRIEITMPELARIVAPFSSHVQDVDAEAGLEEVATEEKGRKFF